MTIFGVSQGVPNDSLEEVMTFGVSRAGGTIGKGWGWRGSNKQKPDRHFFVNHGWSQLTGGGGGRE